MERRDKDAYNGYQANRAVVKQAVIVTKRMADW